MSEWKEFRDELMQDAGVQQAYNGHTVERALARAIIQQRIAHELTQNDMAELMGVPQGNVSRLESGSRTPTIATLQKAASALHIPLEIKIGDLVVALA